MRSSLRLYCASLLFTAAAAVAQPVVVGTIDPDQPGVFLGAGPQTLVDLSHPANRDGNVTTVALVWTGVPTPASCTAAVKIKFLREGTGTFTVVAERGPFPVQSTYFTVTLTPAVTVQAGDLLSVVQLLNTSTCGGVGASLSSTRDTMLRYPGIDLPTGSFAAGGVIVNGETLMARASSDPAVVAAVAPVVGSLQGAFGSFFRTDVQFVNPGSGIITGKLVYHPAGRTAAPDDPSVNYSYGSFRASSISDVVAAMGQSGLGSLDVIPTSGIPPRLILRIYNDAGSAGTSGFTMESLAPDQALAVPSSATLISPADLTNFRMNVGVRTLDDATSIRITGAGGVDVTHTYPPNYFEQGSLATFIGATPVANGFYSVRVNSGSAFIYTTTTDNRTNDSSIRFLKPLP